MYLHEKSSDDIKKTTPHSAVKRVVRINNRDQERVSNEMLRDGETIERSSEISHRNLCSMDPNRMYENATSDYERRKSAVGNNKGRIRYCHFYNRNGCSTLNCQFLHEIAPACEDFLIRRCIRKLCMYRHNKDFHDGTQTVPANIPLHLRWQGNKEYVQQRYGPLHQERGDCQESIVPQHRRRYKPIDHANQMLSSYSHNTNPPSNL